MSKDTSDSANNFDADREGLVEQRQASLAAWGRRRQQLQQWLDEWDRFDAEARTKPSELSPESAATLTETFGWHPHYRGRTLGDVIDELNRLARHAKVDYLLGREHPSPSPEMMRRTQAINAEWAALAGPQWMDEDVSDLAMARFRVEFDKELAMQKEDLTMQAERAAAVDHGREDIFMGVGCAVLGGIITAVTFSGAFYQGGGTYYVMWGSLAWGGFMVLRGLLTILRNRSRQ